MKEVIVDDITTWGITSLKHATSSQHRAAMPIRYEAVSNRLYNTSRYPYNRAATTPNPTIAAKLSTTVFPAAPVNCGRPAELVPLGFPPAPPVAPGAPDMLMMVGLVSFFPPAHEGTGTAERVTITSAGMPVGHPGLMLMIEVGAVALY